MTPGLGAAIYYVGRFLQVLAMWILLADIFLAGPMGPQPKPFFIGIGVFIVGWQMVRTQVRH
jgi:hypothetical protein